MDHHEDECRIEGESNSKQDDEEAVARLEEIKKSIEAKMALRQSNLNPERPDPGFFRTLDSSIKRNTAVIKKLKQINEEQREALMDDLRSVNLSKFVSEAVAAISEAKLRSSDIQAAVQTVEEKDVKPVLFENMKEEEVNRCQIQEWYPKFKSVSIKTLIHQLPESFIQYLLDDSGPFLLPVSVLNEDALPNRIHNPDEEEDFQVSEGSDDEAKESSPPPTFPELELKIKESIESLGGAVFPKLNWSAPKDSAWISTAGTLRCATFSEIALLFRASDSLVHDLCHAYDSCHDKSSSRPQNFFLALRKWYPSLQPDMEFRCFVRGQKLVGISQREVTTFYPILLEKKSSLLLLIQGFFNNYVRAGFVSENYTFDVYITKDERVKVVDFNPWGAFTLPLLFTWDELEHIHSEGDDVEFRIVEDRCAVRPGLKTAVPYDYLDTSQGSGWDQFLRNADEELQRQTRSTEAGA